jgi:type III restriction enzyme
MDESFFERPILNSPYAYPARHWELDGDRQPTNRIVESGRRSELITPMLKVRKRLRSSGQAELGLGAVDGRGASSSTLSR